MAQHCFVAMPFGDKEGVHFNQVYQGYIKPALEEAGFEVFRADEETRAGNIRTDMFQELLLADLVVVDLSIDNPNVWYELGVRHALRARGVIQLQGLRDYMPFDVYTDRTLRYHLKDGVPDPAYLEADRAALARFATETMQAWHGRKVSPVYHLLPFLEEPNWTRLRIAGAEAFWEAHEAWANRIELARRQGKPGDILVLADEAPTRALRLDAHRTAGTALRSLGQFRLALNEYEEALNLDPTDLESRQQKGILLGRLKRHDEAKIWLTEVVEDHPDDAEAWALLGRVEKDAWVEAWRKEDSTPERRRDDAAYEDALLQEAVHLYATGFLKDPRHYYSGVNALTLGSLLHHLTGEEAIEPREAMEGGIRWAIQSALEKDPRDYWALVTLGDLEVLMRDRRTVERAYKNAVAVAEDDWFALDSSRQGLLLLNDLGFRPEEVGAAIRVFDRARARLKPPEGPSEPRLVFLFSGHMIDAIDRPEPRFPPDKEPVAARAIAAQLDELGAGPNDLALCGGACGGDLLFAEACLERGLRLEVQIPFAEPLFLAHSVTFDKKAVPGFEDHWRDRYYAVKEHERARVLAMPDALGEPPKGRNAYARNNLWQLYTALAWGTEKVRFICLWNRQAGDGPGGTRHMHDTVNEYAGRSYILDTNVLW